MLIAGFEPFGGGKALREKARKEKAVKPLKTHNSAK
jgi:hypothetical protein